nr:hypothetical protein CFP56_25456 [Quercus suber]
MDCHYSVHRQAQMSLSDEMKKHCSKVINLYLGAWAPAQNEATAAPAERRSSVGQRRGGVGAGAGAVFSSSSLKKDCSLCLCYIQPLHKESSPNRTEEKSVKEIRALLPSASLSFSKLKGRPDFAVDSKIVLGY